MPIDKLSKSRTPSSLSNRSEVHPDKITTIVINDQKKQQYDQDEKNNNRDLYQRFVVLFIFISINDLEKFFFSFSI